MPNISLKTKKYDCIIPWSGGTESTALVYDCVKRGLNPLCFHVEIGVHWQQQVQAVRTMADMLGVDLTFIEYFNERPFADKQQTMDYYHEHTSLNLVPMFFIWTNMAQLVCLHNPYIDKMYYGFNGGIREVGDGKGDKHSEWVDDHFRSMERVLGKMGINVQMSAPLAHMSKVEQWESIPEDLQQHVHTCAHLSDRHCGECNKCREFDYMLSTK
jgi:7-cyano-7-deazaguanine synthase in queuosine biosynthesis